MNVTHGYFANIPKCYGHRTLLDSYIRTELHFARFIWAVNRESIRRMSSWCEVFASCLDSTPSWTKIHHVMTM